MRFFKYTLIIASVAIGARAEMNCKCQDGPNGIQNNQATENCCPPLDLYPGPNNQCVVYGPLTSDVFDYIETCCAGWGIGGVHYYCWN
ncbi:hypothetical protein JB92DRAFT_2880464 [Gautieria morchelliformis]|nr:hypothetical protein JB92DRAFT_2880464 [Gautieria morchelliformis]